MAVNILVATPQTAIGELLRLSLEEGGPYRVRLTQSGSEAVSAAARISFDLAILDATLPDQPFVRLVQTLCAANPDLRLVIIPPDNDPSKLSLDGLHPDALLSLPFYVPDLLDLVGGLLESAEHWQTPLTGAGDALPPEAFLGERVEVAQALIDAMTQSTALSGLIIRYRLMWIAQGSLDEPQVQTLAALLIRSWDDSRPGDLARFVRPLDSGPEYLLYATAIVPGVLLGLVYEPTTRLTRIRAQARQIAQALRPLAHRTPAFSLPPQPAGEVEAASQPTAAEGPPLLETAEVKASEPHLSPEELEDLLSAVPASGPEASDLLKALESTGDAPQARRPAGPAGLIEASAAAPVSARSLETPEETPAEQVPESEPPQVSLTDLLAAMPPPNPGRGSLSPGGEWVAEPAAADESECFLFPWEIEARSVAGPAPEPAAETKSSLPPAEMETPAAPAASESSAESGSPLATTEVETPFVPAFPEVTGEWYGSLPLQEVNAPPGPDTLPPAEEMNATLPSATAEIPAGPESLEPEDEKSGYRFPWEVEPASEAEIPEPLPEVEEAAPVPELSPAADPSTLEDTKPIPRSVLLGARPVPEKSEPVQAAPESKGPPAAEVSPAGSPEGEPTPGTASPEELAVAVPPVGAGQPLPEIPDEWLPAGELEPSPLDFATLAFTCLLIPASPDHKLDGRLAIALAEWLSQICLAYGWKLEFHKVEPDYLEWTVKVSPAITPSSVIRLVRLQTSQRISSQFGRLAAQIPSGDFWAPGYLITSGSEPPEEQVIKEYIQQTRKRQPG